MRKIKLLVIVSLLTFVCLTGSVCSGLAMVLTESDCWEKAETYFHDEVRWKNPSSVSINNHQTYIEEDEGYIFVIDYSAQNSFGGYTRDKYYIAVSGYWGNIAYASQTPPGDLIRLLNK